MKQEHQREIQRLVNEAKVVGWSQERLYKELWERAFEAGVHIYENTY